MGRRSRLGCANSNGALRLSSGALESVLDLHHGKEVISDETLHLSLVGILLGFHELLLGESVVTSEEGFAAVVVHSKLAHASSNKDAFGFEFVNVEGIVLLIVPIERDGWAVADRWVVSHGLFVAANGDRGEADASFLASFA